MSQKKTTWLRVLACLAIVTASQFALTAEAKPEPSKAEFTLKTDRVIVFKDGYSLIIKRGTATIGENGEAYTDEVPDAAVLGSFWAIPDSGRLLSMTAGWETAKERESKDVPCIQPIEILLSNQGKRAKVELHDKTLYTGEIHQVLIEKSETPVADATIAGLDFKALTSGELPGPLNLLSPKKRREPTEARTLSTVTGANFVLRTDEGDVLLPVAQVRSIVVKDMKTTISKTLTSSHRTKRLSFKFADDKPADEKADAEKKGAKKEQAITLMYFRPGIRWIPTYRVQLSEVKDEKTANVSLQAELLNEAEDLIDVPVDIVVGVPNFRFRETPSPLSLETTLRNALAEAAPLLMGNTSNLLSNAMYSQRAGEFRRNQAQANDVAEGGQVSLPGELTAAGKQDLFVYKLPKITLGQGDRCAVPIFTTDVPYRDIYTWDVQVAKHDIDAAPSGAGIKSPLTLSKNEVWHQIMLTNNTNLPWTTGAAMIMQGQQPVAQELLTYTPPKDEVRVPVTVSVDTRGSISEKEVGRELTALHWDGAAYALIEKEMKPDLCNNKKVEIEAEIKVRIGGKVIDASDNGDVILSPFNSADWVAYHGHPAVNNSSLVTWKVKLKPGDAFTPTIKYRYFTRQ